MDDIAVYLDYFYNSVGDAQKVTGSVPRGIDIANNNLQTYAVEQKGFVVFCFFVGVLVLVGLYVVAASCKNAFLLRLCIVVTEMAVIVLTALCCIEMVLVVSSIYPLYAIYFKVTTLLLDGGVRLLLCSRPKRYCGQSQRGNSVCCQILHTLLRWVYSYLTRCIDCLNLNFLKYVLGLMWF